jgi:hypothetical protein
LRILIALLLLNLSAQKLEAKDAKTATKAEVKKQDKKPAKNKKIDSTDLKDIVKWKTLGKYDPKGKKIPKDIDKALSSKNVSIKGFMIPLDFSSKKISEFLLVPYIPSCMHVPPPPQNQMILVTVGKKVKDEIKSTWYPLIVTGKLQLDKSKKDVEAYFKMTADNLILKK